MPQQQTGRVADGHAAAACRCSPIAFPARCSVRSSWSRKLPWRAASALPPPKALRRPCRCVCRGCGANHGRPRTCAH